MKSDKEQGAKLIDNNSTGRVLSFDLARGIAIFIMILIHVMDNLGHTDVQYGFYGYIINTLTNIFSPTVFLFLMGVNFVFSKRKNISHWVKRGLVLLGLAVLLNFLRGTLPVLVGLNTGFLVSSDLGDFTNPYGFLLEIDIFTCAGMCLILMAVIYHFFKTSVTLCLIGLGIMISVIFTGSPPVTGIFPLDYILQVLIGTEHYVYFPVLPWISFSIMGMAFGIAYKKSEDREKIYVQSITLGCLAIVIGFVFNILYEEVEWIELFEGDLIDGINPLGVNLMLVGAIPLWLAVCDFLVKQVKSNRIFNELYNWSKMVTPVYIIQWTIIGWLSIVTNDNDVLFLILFSMIVIVLTNLVILVWKKILSFFEPRKVLQTSASDGA